MNKNNRTTGGYHPNPPNRPPHPPECKHNFFVVRQDPIVAKVSIVCAWCGQVRELSSTGEVAVLTQKGALRYEV